MAENLPDVRRDALAEAYHAERAKLGSDDPWKRADAEALVWLRSPSFGDGTRDQYARIYRSWKAWCQSIDTPPFEADRRALEAYTLALTTVGNPALEHPKPLSRRTVAQHMAALSSFYARAIDDEVTDRNPVPRRGRPKVSRESRQPHLTPDELRALVATADADSPRSGALVALLVLACLRVSEAIGANIENLSWEGGVRMLWVRRKGDKGQKIPLPPEADERVMRAVGDRKKGPILVTAGGRAWDRSNAWRVMRQLGDAAGIPTPIGPHTLRHAYITRGHEMQIPVADLQDAAGHASPETTRGYDRSQFDPERHPSFKIAADLAASASPNVLD